MSKIRNTGEFAAEKLKDFCSPSLWTSLHHMVILRSQNKITDFFMILVWACPFIELPHSHSGTVRVKFPQEPMPPCTPHTQTTPR